MAMTAFAARLSAASKYSVQRCKEALACWVFRILELTKIRKRRIVTLVLHRFRPVCETMNRAVSTILIPLLLVSQSLFSVPHSHAGSSIVEPDGHSARLHIHLHDHAHEDHHHGHAADEQSSDEAPLDHVPEHDSDAFYSGDVQLLNDGKGAEIAKAELVATAYVVYDDTASLVATRLCTEFITPPLLRPKCALFLQLLSIRC